MLYRLLTAAAALIVLLGGARGAQAGVLITVNKSTQTLSVRVDGVSRYHWPVSTARWGYRTPNGTYRPERLERHWYSRKYHNSPMPYSIFFDGGYAIHGSYAISRIGRPASHGCIRLHPRNAAVLFRLVRENRGDTRIVVTGARGGRSAYAAHRYTERRERHARSERQERRARRYYARRYREAHARQYREERPDDFTYFGDAPPNGYVVYGDDAPGRNYAVRHWWNR
jgi:hypothetical protein